MTKDERAALQRLLDYINKGFCAVQGDCKMLREYLRVTAPKTPASAPVKKEKAKR